MLCEGSFSLLETDEMNHKTLEKEIKNGMQKRWRSFRSEKLMYGIYPLYRIKIGKNDATVIMPQMSPEEKALNWVAYHTGAGEDCNAIVKESEEEKGPVIKILLENEFLICTITSGKQHWGDSSAEAAHETLYQYVTEVFPVRVKGLNLLAQSMGGTSAYPWASSHPERIRRIYGIYPITNLESMGKRNPILNLKPLAEHDIRIMHRHGMDDKIVPFEENARRFEETYRRLGGNITITPIPGLGHQVHPLFFVPNEINTFFLDKS